MRNKVLIFNNFAFIFAWFNLFINVHFDHSDNISIPNLELWIIAFFSKQLLVVEQGVIMNYIRRGYEFGINVLMRVHKLVEGWKLAKITYQIGLTSQQTQNYN